jgi:hypothetical protein
VTLVAAVVAWLGGSVVLLSDGRRGLALGLALVGAGLAGLAFSAGHDLEAVALLAGGAGAAVLRLRDGPGGWNVMPAGSTPRLILSIVTALITLYIATAVTSGEGAGLRFAVLAALTLLVLRVLLGADQAAANTAACGIALALGAGALLSARAAPELACVVAAVVAVGLGALRNPERHGA